MTIAGIPNKALGQICVAVPNVEQTADAWRTILGWPLSTDIQVTRAHDHTHATYHGAPCNSRAAISACHVGALEFEILQPLDRPSAWVDGLDRRGPGVHHLAFFVPATLPPALSFAQHGYTVTQNGLFTGQTGQYTYLDTDRDLGVVLELLEHFRPQAPIDAPIPANGLGAGGVIHVGVLVHNADATARRWSDLFNVPVAFRVETPGYAQSQTMLRGQPSEATATLAFLNFGPLQIELIQPDERPSVWRESLDAHGEGPHHLALRVPDTDAAVAFLARSGIPVVQQGLYADASGRYTYMGSEAALGVMIELLEDFTKTG